MNRKLKQEEFLNIVNSVHQYKYDYSKTIYNGMNKKIIITCPIHGDFEQFPYNHKRGNGCPKCIYNQHSNISIINDFIKKHGNKYDYSKMVYINIDTKISIICKTHGEFKQSPYNHKIGNGCPKCSGKNLNHEELIESFIKVHDNEYDYSRVIYKKNNIGVIIICPIHGEFNQTPNAHKAGNGCPKCNKLEKLSENEILNRFINEHGNKYDYSKTIYNGMNKKIIITCPIHGDFEQKPNNHLHGNGCPKCKESRGENKIRLFLENKKIKYDRQYKFIDCKNILPLPFDFYLSDYNMCIEFNGIQHYKPVKYFGGIDEFNKRKINDKLKMEYCSNNNIPLIIINYNEDVNKVLENLPF